MKFFEKTKGAISIFLALIMLPMFTVAGLIVDGARISAARTSLTGAGDLAINAALSEYDKILLDVYGLFAMSESTEELQKNVSRYFSNTINNTGILEGSDSYTRSFINSIGSMFSSDEISFDNIVDTQVEKFELVEVPNSALGNPTVLERQIIDYMKYRGPVSLGTGLLTKLGCIGETSKQTKALEAKVNYEKKLDSVQDACETAYSAINTFNDVVSSGSSKYKDSGYIANLSSDINAAKTNTDEMVKYLLAYKSDSFKVNSYYKTSYGYKDLAQILIAKQPLSIFNLDTDTKKAIEKHYSDSTSENKALDTMQFIETSLQGTLKLKPLADGSYDFEHTSFVNAMLNLDSTYETSLNNQINAIQRHKAVSGMNVAFTYTVMYEYYFEKLSEEEQVTYKEKSKAFGMAGQIMLASSEFCSSYRSGWKNTVNSKGKTASELLYNWYKEISTIDTALSDAIEALEKVLEKVDDLDTARTSWNNKVDALSEGDIKTSMKGDYENSAKDINAAAINSLIQVLKDNKTHFSKIKEKIDSIKLYDKKICINNASSTDYSSRFSSVPTENFDSVTALSNRVTQIMNSKYANASVSSGITPATYKKITEEQQFYKYLKNVCTAVDGVSTQKESAKSQRKELIKQGNNSSATTADLSGITTGSYIGASGIASSVSDAIDSLANGVDTGANSFDPTAINSDASNKVMADNAKANLTTISTLLEDLGNIAEIARDKVYLEEYFTEMFSCYTSGKGPNGTSVPAKTLSNKDMSTNRFYGSEVEYILWGDNSVESNLNKTKGMIFGIRFALNSVYAFTSSETRTPALTAATAIAGWTGFGVPIVQTVILLAWSMAESVVDVNNLCAGEAVCVYKSRDTWVLGINGVIDWGAQQASKAVGDIFDKIENMAVDSIDSAQSEIQTYVNDTTKGLVESIQGSVMSSLERLIVQIVGESNYNLQKSDINAKVEAMINEILSNASSDSISDNATRLAVDAIKSRKNYIVDTIYNAYTDVKNGATETVSNKVEELLNAMVTPIRNSINGAVATVGDELKTKTSQIISAGGDQVKEKLSSAIEEYMGKLGGSDGSGATSLASGFSLTYKEYLKAFVMINMVGNETSMLKRCAKLIQANVSSQNTSFNIASAYTMVEVNATVSIRTTFFNVPIISGVDADGNPVYDLDFSNIGTGRQKIKYVGILGY